MPSPRTPEVSEPLTNLPLGKGVRLLISHPSGLLAVEKPVGVRSHPNDKGVDPRALLLAPYDSTTETYRWRETGGQERHCHLLNRLDTPTSGLLLVCVGDQLAEAVRQAFQERRVEKLYWAVVKGRAEGLRSPWKDRFTTDRRGDMVRSHCGGQGDFAVTQVERLALGLGPLVCALLALEPKTGRSHQLRVQCAERDLPIVGDATYGDFAFNHRIAKLTGCERLCLHAARLRMALRFQSRTIDFSAESSMPAEFEKFLRPAPSDPAG